MRCAQKLPLAAAAAFALVSAIAGVAHAGDVAGAEVLFKEGVEHLKKGSWAAACDAFQKSNEADPAPGAQMNLGVCNEKQGRLASAWQWYLSAVPLAKDRGQKERAESAKREADRLEPMLHKLIINVRHPVEGLTVSRDGVLVSNATLGREVPVDPGEHVLEVSAKGKKPWKGKVTTGSAPGVADTFDVPALEDAPEAPAAAGGTTHPTPGSDTSPPTSGGSDGTTQRNIGFVVGGAGLVALATAGVLLVLTVVVDRDAQKTYDQLHGPPDCTASPPLADDTYVPDARSTCGNIRASYREKKDAAKANQLAAIITGAGGAALLGVGATLILTSGGSKKSGSRLVPMVGPGHAGAMFTTSF